MVVVEVAELFTAPAGDGAAFVVDAWTSVIGELSLVLAGCATVEVAGLAWEVAAGTDWSVPVGRDFGADVVELVCASERVMAPSNAAVPQMKCLR